MGFQHNQLYKKGVKMDKKTDNFFNSLKYKDTDEEIDNLQAYKTGLFTRLSLVGDLIELVFTGGIRYVIVLMKNLKNKEMDSVAYKSLCQFVPKVIENGTILSFYDLIAAPRWLTDAEIKEHFLANIAEWDNNTEKYLYKAHIIDQNLFAKYPLYFGKKNDGSPQTADFNTCGVVSLYNVLTALTDGNAPAFPVLLRCFEEHGIALNGAFGVSPSALNEYLIEHGYRTRLLTGKAITPKNMKLFQDTFDAFIVTVFNNGDDLSEMMHTMAITKDDEYYYLNNDYSACCQDNEKAPAGRSVSDSIETLLNNYRNFGGNHCRPISLIGIKK